MFIKGDAPPDEHVGSRGRQTWGDPVSRGLSQQLSTNAIMRNVTTAATYYKMIICALVWYETNMILHYQQ